MLVVFVPLSLTGNTEISLFTAPLFLVLDAFDGELARLNGEDLAMGRVLDVTCDRVCDAALLAGVSGSFVLENDPGLALLAFGAGLIGHVQSTIGMFTTDLDLQFGWFQRTERISLLLLIGLVGPHQRVAAGILACIAMLLGVVAIATRFVGILRRVQQTGFRGSEE